DVEMAAGAGGERLVVPVVARLARGNGVAKLVAGIGAVLVVEVVIAGRTDDEEITAIDERSPEMLEFGDPARLAVDIEFVLRPVDDRRRAHQGLSQGDLTPQRLQ